MLIISMSFRNVALGFCNIFNRLAGVITPQILLLVSKSISKQKRALMPQHNVYKSKTRLVDVSECTYTINSALHPNYEAKRSFLLSDTYTLTNILNIGCRGTQALFFLSAMDVKKPITFSTCFLVSHLGSYTLPDFWNTGFDIFDNICFNNPRNEEPSAPVLTFAQLLLNCV